jgi:hypothetical protein
LSERQAGKPAERYGDAAEGETFEERNPMSVIDLKQGRRGFGRKKASGGWETLEAQLNPGEANPGPVASRFRKR